MKEKIKKYTQVIFICVCLVLCFSLLKSIFKITGSNQKLVDERQKVLDVQKENDKLQKELLSVQTPQFIESQARDKLGLAKKGEIVVVLPDTNTLKSLTPHLEEKTYSLPDPIWKLWMKLFL